MEAKETMRRTGESREGMEKESEDEKSRGNRAKRVRAYVGHSDNSNTLPFPSMWQNIRVCVREKDPIALGNNVKLEREKIVMETD